MLATYTSPAHLLEGKILKNGWVVKKKIEKSVMSTGGNFSVSYIVQKNEGEAFLKAIDLYSFSNIDGTTENFQALSLLLH